MAIRWIDGFDFYSGRAQIATRYIFTESHANLSLESSVGRADSLDGRYGGLCLCPVRTNGGYTTYYKKTFAHIAKTDRKTASIGFAFKMHSSPGGNNNIDIYFQDDTVDQFYINNNLNTNISSLSWFWNGASRAITFVGLNHMANIFADPTNWHYYEFSISGGMVAGVEAPAVGLPKGALWVYRDGILIDSRTGITTTESWIAGRPNSTGYNTVKISFRVDQGVSNKYYFDDYYIDIGASPNVLGEISVKTLFPTGDGSYQEFGTQGSANHFENINEYLTGNMSDYNYSQSGKDTYGFDQITGNVSIHGIQLNYLAGKTGVGTKTLTPIIYSNSLTYTGTTGFALAESGYHSYLMETDPATSLAWAKDGVNSSEFGLWATTGFDGLG